MKIEEERKAFNQWVLSHPDNLDLTAYEENIMFDAWLASANREGYKLVPLEPTYEQREKAEHLYIVGCVGIFEAVIGACDEH